VSKHDHGGHHGHHDERSSDDASPAGPSAGAGDSADSSTSGASGGSEASTGAPSYPRLEDCDLTLKLSKDEEAKRLGKAQRRLLHLRLINGGQLNNGDLGPPVCIVFEGWDAAGKGGAIKRLVEPLDPRHVHVAPFAAPTPDELRHHFLWRFWPPLPGWGGMTIFDRSWYGRVLVERVENFATEVQWRRAYQEITDFEHSLAEEGMVVIKLWLHMSDAEQLRRFERRRDDPLKAWKLTDEDWRNREKRAQYDEAVADMLRLTNGPLAPWDVISSESKRNGRVEVIETVIRHMEEGMARWGIPVPARDDEEKTELALSFDDAEFQNGPDGANGANASNASNGSAESVASGAGSGTGTGNGTGTGSGERLPA
jgi:polyphosphate kinase 2 (PPK2 family)